jgi:hypothetical protein
LDRRRHIGLLIGRGDFTQENLTTVFTTLAEEYRHPDILDIRVLSDRNALMESQHPYFCKLIRDANGDEWNAFVVRIYWRGHYRAKYHRSWTLEETYEYSPDPEKDELIKVVLRKGRY